MHKFEPFKIIIISSSVKKPKLFNGLEAAEESSRELVHLHELEQLRTRKGDLT
jgi:hypothetical protein